MAIGQTVGSIINGIKLNKIGVGGMVNIGMNAWMLGSTYNMARQEGAGQIGAGAKAIAETVMMDVIGMPAYFGMMAVTGLPKVAVSAGTGLNKMARSMAMSSRNRPFNNATFVDNQQAYTMRQAGMQMARASKYNTQQAMLGNEAQYLHY